MIYETYTKIKGAIINKTWNDLCPVGSEKYLIPKSLYGVYGTNLSEFDLIDHVIKCHHVKLKDILMTFDDILDVI